MRVASPANSSLKPTGSAAGSPVPRRQIVQQHRVNRSARPWCHGIPESDVHLGHAARVGKLAIQRHAHAAAACILAAHIDPDRGRVEDDAVICRLLAGECAAADLEEASAGVRANPFLAYNLAVATETPRSWSDKGGPPLLNKLVFQEFRFDVAGKANPMSIRKPDGTKTETSAALVSIGSWAENNIEMVDASVSRRHALIANFPNDVWLYDLGSTRGTRLDGGEVTGRAFLDGVHRVMVGRVEVEIGSRADLLV